VDQVFFAIGLSSATETLLQEGQLLQRGHEMLCVIENLV